MNRRDFLKVVALCFGLIAIGDAMGGCGVECDGVSDGCRLSIKRGFYIRAIKYDSVAKGDYHYMMIGDMDYHDHRNMPNVHDGSYGEDLACNEVVPFDNTVRAFDAYKFFISNLKGFDDISLIFYKGGREPQIPYILQSTLWDMQDGLLTFNCYAKEN